MYPYYGTVTYFKFLNSNPAIHRSRLFNRIQEGETPGENPESEFLTTEDFEVGAPIGEGSHRSAETV